MTTEIQAKLVADTRCGLGESPFWDPAARSLYWIDIDASVLHGYRETGELSERDVPDGTTFAADASAGMVIAGPYGLATLDSDDDVEIIAPPWFDPEKETTNDGAVDSRGRTWIGWTTRTRDPESGSLGMVTGDRVVERAGGLSLPNGIGWSPDDRTMYFVDTFGGTVWQAAFSGSDGDVGRPAPFFTPPSNGGLIDGLAVDATGHVWMAVWGGGAVLRVAPDGNLVGRVVVDAPKVTSCAFVDETLFITTANPDGADAPPAGGLFAADVGVPGVPVVPAVREQGAP